MPAVVQRRSTLKRLRGLRGRGVPFAVLQTAAVDATGIERHQWDVGGASVIVEDVCSPGHVER